MFTTEEHHCRQTGGFVRLITRGSGGFAAANFLDYLLTFPRIVRFRVA